MTPVDSFFLSTARLAFEIISPVREITLDSERTFS